MCEIETHALNVLQGPAASGDFDETSLALAQMADAVMLWQQRLDVQVMKNPTAVYPLMPNGEELTALVNGVLDLVPEGADEQGAVVARKIFYHMFDLPGNRSAS